jgi:NADPH:quinone reductase-like Zn-dependent oxidoreductase/acyl carrier protein
LHPVLVDAGFQALSVIGAPEDGHGPLVPVSVNEVRLHGSLDAAPWVVADLIHRTPNSFTASLTFCDAEGKIVAEVEGVRCQRLPTADTAMLARAAFVDQWERAPVSNLERGPVQAWLFVADEGDELAGEVADELRNRGHECRRIGFAALAIAGTSAEVDGIVWFAPIGSVGDAGVAVSAGLLEAVQHILRASDMRPRLVIVTRGAEGRTRRPEHAALWGLARVAATENPSLSLTVVDCEEDERVPAWLAAELLGDSVETEVRLGSEGRLVPRLQPWSAPQPQPEIVDVADVAVALRQARPGVQDSLVWYEVGRSEPGPGEIEVRSIAAGLNFKDILKTKNLLSGAYLEDTFFGDTLGTETAGVVTRVGPGVTDFASGDKVVGVGPGFASYLIVKTSYMCHQPARLLPTEAPVLANYVTAYHGLVEVGRLQRGEWVLIHLASGGVGQAAVSIARMVGAEIIATAGDADKRAYLKAQGIAHVFDSRTLDFADRVMEVTHGVGVDVVLNSLPGEALRLSWDTLAPYGRFIEIGKRDIEENSALPMRHFDKNRSFAAVDVDRMLRERSPMFMRIASDVERMFADGRIEPMPVTVFPAAQVLEAFQLMSRARHIGKVVVDFRDQKVPALRLPPPRFRKDRTYLVTGAFGGFGMALVRWLAREGVRHLVLVGRRGAATEQGRAMLAELEAQGVRVDARALDVADLGMVEKLVADIRRNGPPLGGVFHLAMVLDDALLPSLDAQRLAAVMQPKAVGAWHLHRACAGDPLDHFVLFSSVAQVIGNMGQAAYCAANAFLDGLARQRRANGLPGLSIAWGVLSDAGVAARGDGLVEQLERLGIRAFTTARGLEALGQLMDNCPATITFADVDWQRWASHSALGATPRFNQLVESSSGGGDRLAAFCRELAEHPAAERLGFLQAQLAAALSAVLGIPADRIPPDRSFDNLGVDSLMAVELSASLEEKTGVKLSTSMLLQRATVTSLAAHVLNEVLATNNVDEMALDEPSETEAGALLEQLAAPGE